MSGGRRMGGWAGIVAVLVTAGCAAGASEPQAVVMDADAQKNGVPVAITSLDWLQTECPGLADATEVVYYGGFFGELTSRAIGPTDSWRDLVVTLPDGAAHAWVDAYGLKPQASRPDVVALLEPEIPAGVLLRSDALDDALCDSWHGVSAWVSVDTDQVVMTVTDS